MLKILAVDDEPICLKSLEREILKAEPDAQVTCCLSAASACVQLKLSGADVAFVDIELPDEDGIELAQRLYQINPRVNIIFATAYEEYALRALGVHPSGYVLKPVSSKDVAVELRSLRTPVDRRAAARVRIECFGGFEVYVSGERLNITRPTCKELLAFLVHRRGKGVTASEIAATLWPEKRYTRSLQSQIQKTIKNLRVLLDEHGVGDIVVRERNYIALETSLVSCDFYEYLAGMGTSGLDAYRGLYLEPYAWADLPITGTRLERLA